MIEQLASFWPGKTASVQKLNIIEAQRLLQGSICQLIGSELAGLKLTDKNQDTDCTDKHRFLNKFLHNR
jgi:hypothetical protein